MAGQYYFLFCDYLWGLVVITRSTWLCNSLHEKKRSVEWQIVCESVWVDVCKYVRVCECACFSLSVCVCVNMCVNLYVYRFVCVWVYVCVTVCSQVTAHVLLRETEVRAEIAGSHLDDRE